MDSATVLKLVEAELENEWDRVNAHGVDLPKCVLRPPMREVFHWRTPQDEPSEFRFWLVLIEPLVDDSGYGIFYDDAENLFGLATKLTDGTWLYLGHHGSFLESLESM